MSTTPSEIWFITPVSLQVGRVGLVQHVFDPVRAVGNLHGDPFGHVVFHAAMPVRTKAENVAVKMVLGRAVVDEEASVDHVA